MGRVALVTGGTRGIGAAICKALKQAGYNVAANYGGNDDAANAFKKETKIPVFKWDVGDYVACGAGHRQCRERGRSDRSAGQQCRHLARRHAAKDDA